MNRLATATTATVHNTQASLTALFIDGRLHDLLTYPNHACVPGAIFAARVLRQQKHQGGVFVALPNGQNGFLRRYKTNANLLQGSLVLVQISSYADAPHKAIPLTNKIVLRSPYALITLQAPGIHVSRRVRKTEHIDQLRTWATQAMQTMAVDESYGVVVRSAAVHVPQKDFVADLCAVLARAVHVRDMFRLCVEQKRIDMLLPALSAIEHLKCDWSYIIPPIPQWRMLEGEWQDWSMDNAVDDEALALAAQTSVGLANGAEIHIEATRALVAVDVDTAKDTTPAAALKTNLAMANIIPSALRLRGLGGQIVIDAAPMAQRERNQIETALRAACKNDPVPTTLVGWTALGHMELHRKRIRLPLLADLLPK